MLHGAGWLFRRQWAQAAAWAGGSRQTPALSFPQHQLLAPLSLHFQGNLYDVYKREFDRNYNGGRAGGRAGGPAV